MVKLQPTQVGGTKYMGLYRRALRGLFFSANVNSYTNSLSIVDKSLFADRYFLREALWSAQALLRFGFQA